MAHTDVVNVDPKKWTHPPFGAVARRRLHLRPRHRRRQGQRRRVADDDAAAEAPERAAGPRRDLPRRSRRGRLDARRHQVHDRAALPEDRGGVLPRRRRRREPVGREGEVRLGADAREDAARHRAGRPRASPGTVRCRCRTNPIVHLSAAVARVADMEAADAPQRHDARVLQAAGRALDAGGCASATWTSSARIRSWPTPPTSTSCEHEPRHASMIRTSISPNIFQGGYRVNVIPSEARATLDVRTHPGRRSGAAARGSAEGRQRSRDRGGLGPARRPAVGEQRASSTRKRSRRSRPGSRSTTTRSRCRR